MKNQLLKEIISMPSAIRTNSYSAAQAIGLAITFFASLFVLLAAFGVK